MRTLEVHPRRDNLPLLEGLLRSPPYSDLLGELRRVIPMRGGKKGLVYHASGSKGHGVVRVFKDPIKLAKTLKMRRLCEDAGVSIPRLMRLNFTPGVWKRGWLAILLEEMVDQWARGADLRDLVKELLLLHSIRRRRWGGVFIGKRGGFWEEVLRAARSRLERWKGLRNNEGAKGLYLWLDQWEERLKEPSDFSLLHNDLVPTNVGLRDGKVVLIDLDRACFGHPLEELVKVCYHFCRDEEERSLMMRWYFPSQDLPEEIPLFWFLLHLKRLARALKHFAKGEAGWMEVVVRHEEALMGIISGRYYGSSFLKNQISQHQYYQ